MAVFSIIKLSKLEGAKRIDAEFYRPEYLEVLKKIKKLPHKKLGDLCLKITDGSHQTPPYQESGIPFLMVKNVLEQQINFDQDISFISEDFDKKLKHCKPGAGDILLTKVGSVGISAVVPDDAPSFNIFVSIAVIKNCGGIDKFFLSTFLNSKFGRTQAIRAAKGISQPDLHLEDIKEFLIPIFPKDQQKEISKLVIEAINLFKDSKSLYSQAENFLLEELGLKDFKPKYEKTYTAKLSDAFLAHRIDAEYFQPAYEEVIEKIENYKNGFDRLLKHVENIKPNFDPTKYPDKIFSYIELADIDSSIGVIHSVNKVKGGEAPSRARRLLKEGDVIVSSVEGSLEKVALIDREHDACLASTGFFQFRPLDILPEVLLVLSKTIILQLQLKKRCSGTILTAVPKESLIDIIIPLLPLSTQQEIASLVKQSHEARKEAKELLEVAKKAVEIAIEEGEEKAKIYLLNHRIKNEFI